MFSRLAIVLGGTALLLAAQPTLDAGEPQEPAPLAVLQSGADLEAKAHACQRLGEVGTGEAVPALAGLLSDEPLGTYARSALERIPDPRAVAALRSAAASLAGPQRAGVVGSLGVRRDAEAVPMLCQLARDPASGLARDALLALGRIATDDAVHFLRQALASGAETERADAAAACLLAAEKQWGDGHAGEAVLLYDAVRQAPVPLPYRMGAVRGAILARGADGVPLLMESLRSAEPGLRDAALLAIRERPSTALASALNAEVERAPVEMQPRLLTALVDCHDAQSLAVLRGKATSQGPAVRRTALAILGTLGGAAEAEVLIRAVAVNQSPEDSAIAVNSLRRLSGADVDGQILRTLAAATDTPARVQLVRLLETRGATNATGELLRLAADADAGVAVAALRALKALAGAQELPGLIGLVKASREEAVRDAAEGAVVGVCARAGTAASASEIVLAELMQAKEATAKGSWIRILASLGQATALPAVRGALTDADATVVRCAIEQLGRWPEPAPMEDLFGVVSASPDASCRQRALASAIRLATAAADRQQAPAEQVVGWLRRADRAAQSAQERLLIISALGRVRDAESLHMLTSHLDDPEVRTEAALAIVQIADAVGQEDPGAVAKALEKTLAVVSDAGIRDQATKLAKAVSGRALPTPLFDGQSLAGWEGDTTVWRVRDGVLVGGSLDGNAGNEFLATTQAYGNAVLRFEYKLVGTEGFVNGGVQFRSTRVPPPSREMCGYQADIGAGYTGSLYDESRRNRVLAQAKAERVRVLEVPNEWNRYEVRCLGPRVQLVVNGEKTVDYTETDPAIPLEGLIALQIHGGCKAEIAFRNLTVAGLSYGLATREFCVPRDRWKILSYSSENTQGEDERAVLAIDGNPGTFWHTQWSGAQPGHPHHLAIDLGEGVEMAGFTYLPRQDGRHEKGVIGAYEVYASADGKDWGQAITKGRLENTDRDPAGRVVVWPRPVTARYLKLVSLDAPGGHPFAGAAEIGVLGRVVPR